MNKRNTVSRGNAFEMRVHDLIKNAVDNFKFGVIPSCCRIFRKKAYFSRDTETYIEFDLSIEVWLEGATTYSNLYLIECKDYSTENVPAADIEEFKAKVDQIAGLMVKAVVVTTSPLQDRGYKYAKKWGMMWIKVKSEEHEILLYSAKQKRNSLLDTNVLQIKQEKEELNAIQSFIFSGDPDVKFDWDILIEKFISQAASGNLLETSTEGAPVIGLERLSHRIVENISERILDSFNPMIRKHHLPLDEKSFSDFLKETHKISVSTQAIPDSKGRKIMGIWDRNEKSIILNRELSGTDRYKFVLCHEVSHFFLHSSVEMQQTVYDSQSDSEFNAQIGKHELLNERHWMEWQANQLAVCMLLPKISVMVRLIEFQYKMGIPKKGKMYADNAAWNQRDFLLTLDHLSRYFGVSTTVMEYRLADIGILKYAKNFRRPSTSFSGKAVKAKTVGEILQKLINGGFSGEESILGL